MSTRAKQRSAARQAAVAAAYEPDTEVRVLVTRDVGIAEGDVGSVTEVRDGSFYRVAVGDSEDTYAWLAEDELELVASEADPAETPADPNEDPAASGDEMDDEEQPAARRAKPSAFQSAIAAARTAERQRITGILALRTKASVDALLTLCADPRCTPEAAAHRLLTGKVQGARPDALGQLAGDEAALQAAGGLSAVADGAQPQTDAQRIVATAAQFNPRAIARKPRG